MVKIEIHVMLCLWIFMYFIEFVLVFVLTWILIRKKSFEVVVQSRLHIESIRSSIINCL